MGKGLSEGWGHCKDRAVSVEWKPAPPVSNLLEKPGEVPVRCPGPQARPHPPERLRGTTL